MCGIAGIRFKGDSPRPDGAAAAIAAAMAQTMAHRGPDDADTWESPDGTLALAHRRLAVLDLSPMGRNPMCWDGRLWVTFNGEIYNFLELRQELEAEGYRFRSHTDTEVILASYDRWGLDSVRRFVGMFAFGLWDAHLRRLWLVRDRLGKKPVYYSDRSDSFSFASELKAITRDPSMPRAIDPTALRLYLRYGYVPAPYAIFTSARKLEPGHFLVYENDRTEIVRYWDPIESALGTRHGISDAEAEAELESTLATAVRQRLISDVPLGAFLSGGIDSSLVVALMTEQSSRRVRTFAIRFDDEQFDEADHAAAVARHLGTDHHEQRCDEPTMLAVIDRLPEMFDEPFADSSAIPTYVVSSIARQEVTVALSGDGGDELFVGYPRYRHYGDIGRLLQHLPRPLAAVAAAAARRSPTRRTRRIADVLENSDADPYARFVTWLPNDAVTRLAGEGAPDAPLYRDVSVRMPSVPLELRAGLLDLVSYLPDDILTKVDRASMAVSLEVRAPLLDHRVVELALRLPITLKRRGRTMKWLLRQLLYRRVPKALIDRPKMGFGVPLLAWFGAPLRDRMNEYCGGHDFEDLGLSPEPWREMWRQFSEQDRSVRPDLLWQALMLAAWSRSRRAPAPIPNLGS